jgi:transcriptional regulator of acetoin/glycerol metabolism
LSLIQPVSGHVAAIMNVVNHQLCSQETSPVVARSWARCLQDFKLDPAQVRIPPILSQSELNVRRERMSGLIACAKLEMTTLYQQLADPELAVVLTDADGVILHMVSSSGFAQDVESLGFRVGAVWSEREAGTNGMGTCLAEGEPVAVRQNEHYFAQYTSLTCSAAPIFDHRGEIAGVLDVTSRSRLLQQHSLVLVGMSRQMIENRLLDERFKDAHPIHFHTRPELVYTLHEGKLAVDQQGNVLAANRSALFQLGFRSLPDLLGKRVDDVFKTSLEEILARSSRNSFRPVPVYRVSASNRFFMVAQYPHANGTSDSTLELSVPQPGRARVISEAPSNPARKADAGTRLAFGDAAMEQQVQLARKIIDKQIPIMLHGETGSGKEVFASAIHRMSQRGSGPFVAVNCASLPETLIESELFGYRAGAFTGAQREGRRGKIIQANGGTLFLDEIGDMPMMLQARLLRVLEERQVTPLGSETVVNVDFQLVSASHRNLAELVQSGQFREDLYYRLNGIELRLPPLRARTDKLALMEHILREETADQLTPSLALEAEQALLRYQWPGNIRQLRHVLRTAIALCDNGVITCRHLPPEISNGSDSATLISVSEAEMPIEIGHTATNEAPIPPFNAIQLNERTTILGLLDKHRWNVSTVSRTLGVSRNTLYRKMHRLHIRLAQSEAQDKED